MIPMDRYAGTTLSILEYQICPLYFKKNRSDLTKARGRSESPKKHVTFGENTVVEIKPKKKSIKKPKNIEVSKPSKEKKPEWVLQTPKRKSSLPKEVQGF